jgi:hypothetical protein
MSGDDEPVTADATGGARAPTGVLVIRVWRERSGDDPQPGLRARLLGTLDAEHGGEGRPEYAQGIDAILDRTRAWLQVFERSWNGAPPSATVGDPPTE